MKTDFQFKNQRIYMTQTLPTFTNQSLLSSPRQRNHSLMSSFGTDIVNKSFQFDSESQNSLDNIELLRLEVKQLQRENQFLKKKIQELKTGGKIKMHQWYKKQSINCINAIKKNAQLEESRKSNSDQLSFVFNQIQNILQSLASIHKLEIDSKLWIPNTDRSSFQESLQEDSHCLKNNKQFNKGVNKKLEMISLQSEEKKFESLLQLFQEFYVTKVQCQKRAKQRIQKFIEKTLQMGKNIIQSANSKRQEKSLKSSRVYSFRSSMDETSIQGVLQEKQNNFEFFNIKTHQPKHQLSNSAVNDVKIMIKQVNKDKFCF